MPIKDPIIRKEYARLSMLIKYTRDRGEDTSHLLDQRKSIIKGIRYNSIKNTSGIITSIRKKSISIKPSNQLLENVLNEVKQIKEQNDLLHYKLTEYFQERISQLEQTISELQSQNQTLIKTISEKKSESKTKEKNTIKKLILTPQLRKQLKKETANMVK